MQSAHKQACECDADGLVLGCGVYDIMVAARVCADACGMRAGCVLHGIMVVRTGACRKKLIFLLGAFARVRTGTCSILVPSLRLS